MVVREFLFNLSLVIPNNKTLEFNVLIAIHHTLGLQEGY